jgi:signal transduction histidine kinase
LDDTKFERDVIIRSYVQRRVTTEVDFDNLVKTIANVIEAARAEENQK